MDVFPLFPPQAIVINSTAKRTSTVGEVVNLMSVDAQKLDEAAQLAHMLWASPLIITIALFFLWQQIGVATFGGLFVMVMLVPLNVWLTNRARSLQVGIVFCLFCHFS